MNLRTREEMIAALKQGGREQFRELPWGTSCLDFRDLNRLLLYLTWEEASDIYGTEGFKDAAEDTWGEPEAWDEETITEHMRDSLEFAFEKALRQRGISASLMHTVMSMWVWVIGDDDLLEDNDYFAYGLSFLYKIRDKYFPEMKVE